MAKQKISTRIDPNEVIDRFGRDPASYFFTWVFIVVITVDYTVADGLDHAVGNWFYVLPALGAVLSILALMQEDSKSKLLATTGWFYLLSFNAVVNLAFIFIIPVHNPYAIFLALLMFITTYWKGLPGYLAALGMQIASISIALLVSDLPLNESASYYYGSIMLVTSMAFGGVALRLTSFDRLVRDEFVKSSKKINLERERLKSLINSVGDAVIATDKKGHVILFNGIAHDFVNTSRSIKQKHINDIVDLKDENGNDIDIISLIKSAAGVITRDDFHLESDESREIAVRVTGSPINAASVSRSDQGYIFLLADITKEKSLSQQQDEFVHLLSHELRTPIAIIEGGIDIVMTDKKHPPSRMQKTWLKRSYESTVYLSNLLNDLASLTQVERDNLRAVPMVTRPYNLLKRLAEDYEEEAAKREITIEIAKGALKQRIISSEVHIHEILQNLVSNAIKYTRENTTITLDVRKSGAGAIFSVQDQGMGISKENQKQLFSKYFRGDDSSTKKAQGTGLGLYIAFKLAKRIGGKIWVESQLGSGAIFFLEVPNMVKKDKKAVKAKQKRSH